MGEPSMHLLLDRPVRLAGFVFDPQAGELAEATAVHRLGEKPAAALEALVAARGRVVDRVTLCRHLWPDGTVVDFDNNLNAAIKKLRDALGDDAATPRFIETLPRRGYRFVGPIDPAGDPAIVDRPGSAPGHRGWRRLSRPLRVLAAVALVSLAAVAVLWLRDRAAGPAVPPGPAQARLVVLPFATLGEVSPADTPPDWLRQGLTEELITLLGRLDPSRLGVIARHSSMRFQDTETPLSEIASTLDVQWAIEGTVATVADRALVSVRLVRVDEETVAWSGRFEAARGAIDALTRHVAVGVGTALADHLLTGDPGARLRGATVSSDAYEAFLMGRAAWHRFEGDSFLEARQAFDRSLAADPDFAPAHAALADTYNLLAFTPHMDHVAAFAAAESAAREALARDPDLAMAHNALGFARLYGRFDVGGALSHFARAVEIDPNYAMAHHWRAGALAAAGRVDEAVAAAEHAVNLDPLSLSVISDLGWYLIFADRFEEAAVLCRETLDENPAYGWAISCLNEASRRTGDLGTAARGARERMRPTEHERTEDPTIDEVTPALALVALDRLALRRQRSREEPHALSMAEAHARVGDRDASFEWLDRAAEARDPWLLFIPLQPFFDDLHGDPRLADLAERIGLPAEVRRALAPAPTSG